MKLPTLCRYLSNCMPCAAQLKVLWCLTACFFERAGAVKFPKHPPLTQHVRDLIIKLLRPNPDTRISLLEVEVSQRFRTLFFYSNCMPRHLSCCTCWTIVK